MSGIQTRKGFLKLKNENTAQFLKWATDLNRCFTKEGMQVAINI